MSWRELSVLAHATSQGIMRSAPSSNRQSLDNLTHGQPQGRSGNFLPGLFTHPVPTAKLPAIMKHPPPWLLTIGLLNIPANSLPPMVQATGENR